MDNSGKTAIVYAAGKGFVAIVTVLLDAGIDVNARYGNELSALMWAAGHANENAVAHSNQVMLADEVANP